jgi:hypothetical protein
MARRRSRARRSRLRAAQHRELVRACAPALLHDDPHALDHCSIPGPAQRLQPLGVLPRQLLTPVLKGIHLVTLLLACLRGVSCWRSTAINGVRLNCGACSVAYRSARIDMPVNRRLTPGQRRSRLDGGSVPMESSSTAPEWRERARGSPSATGMARCPPPTGGISRSSDAEGGRDAAGGPQGLLVGSGCTLRGSRACSGQAARGAGRCASSRGSSSPRLVGARHGLRADSATGACRRSGRRPDRRRTASSPPRSPAREVEGP